MIYAGSGTPFRGDEERISDGEKIQEAE